jgi:hypothetical protein
MRLASPPPLRRRAEIIPPGALFTLDHRNDPVLH